MPTAVSAPEIAIWLAAACIVAFGVYLAARA